MRVPTARYSRSHTPGGTTASPRGRPRAADRARQRRPCGARPRGASDVAVVAAEQLVAAVAGQAHRDVPPRQLATPGRSGSARSRRTARRRAPAAAGSTRQRLVAARRTARCDRCRGGAATACARAAPRRSRPRAKPIVNVRTGRGALRLHQRDDRRRVDPAGEERAERHVGHHLRRPTASRSSALELGRPLRRRRPRTDRASTARARHRRPTSRRSARLGACRPPGMRSSSDVPGGSLRMPA